MAKKDDKKGGKPEASADDIMSAGEMKSVLAKAKRGDPVNCAIGLTADKEGVILVDKKVKAKKLRTLMKQLAAKAGLELDAQSIRFGRASVDTDIDATLVTFTVNKDSSGAMRKPLIDRVKQAGYSKVEVVTDSELENESEEDEVAGAPAVGAAPAAPEATPAPAPSADASGDVGGAAPPNPDAALLAELTAKLGGLLKQLPAVLAGNPGMKDALVALAETATAGLKGGEAEKARVAIETLAERIGGAPTQSDQGGGNGRADANARAVADKAQQVWEACLKMAAREVDKLRTEVTAAYKDHGFGTEVEKFFSSQIDPALKKLESADLTATLAAASKTADASERHKLLGEGIKIVESLEGMVAGDPVIKQLDDNPFTKLVLAKTTIATLGKLKQTLQTADRG